MKQPVNLVLGTMTFGESVFPPMTEEILQTFLARGYHELDTAYVYNEGASERLLGEALKTVRKEDLAISTKVNPRISGKLDGEAAYRQLNESLERLGLPRVYTFYLHFPDPNTPLDDVLAACAELYAEGKFLQLGVSNFPAWLVAEAWHRCYENDWPLPAVYQGMYNPLMRRAEAELAKALEHYGMRFYAYNPLAGGLLTGRYEHFEEAPTDGRFTHRPNYQKRYWKKSYFEAIDILKEACAKEGIGLVEAVYRWLSFHSMLDASRGDAVLIGASRPQHLIQNMDAVGRGPLSEEICAAFETAWELTRSDCPEYFTFYKPKK